MTEGFGQVMRQIHEMLATSYGDYVAHALDFKATPQAEEYLAAVSFTDGRTLQDLTCLDRMKIAPVLLPNGVFVVLGGQFTSVEHEEIRRKADEHGVPCKSVCIADDGSQVQREFMTAASRLQEAQPTEPEQRSP